MNENYSSVRIKTNTYKQLKKMALELGKPMTQVLDNLVTQSATGFSVSEGSDAYLYNVFRVNNSAASTPIDLGAGELPSESRFKLPFKESFSRNSLGIIMNIYLIIKYEYSDNADSFLEETLEAWSNEESANARCEELNIAARNEFTEAFPDIDLLQDNLCTYYEVFEMTVKDK